MIRLLIRVGAGVVLVGVLYNLFGRHGAHHAAARAEAIQVAGVSVPVAKAPASSRRTGRGLSFALADTSTVSTRVAHLSCHGEPG